MSSSSIAEERSMIMKRLRKLEDASANDYPVYVDAKELQPNNFDAD